MHTALTFFLAGLCTLMIAIVSVDVYTHIRIDRDTWECTQTRTLHEVNAEGATRPIVTCLQYSRTY